MNRVAEPLKLSRRMSGGTPNSWELLRQAAEGDSRAWGMLLMEHSDRLRRIVLFRMDPRLRGRIDAADVVQEAYLEATDHRGDFFSHRDLSLFLWLRGIVSNKLLEMHRRHLGTLMRSAAKEIGLNRLASADTSMAMAEQLTNGLTGPSDAAVRAEARARLHQALERLDAIDREVLALRHFEQLTNLEAARVLEIQESASTKRYIRALKRLKDVLAEMPGGLTGMLA